jgi:hypothetical protein
MALLSALVSSPLSPPPPTTTMPTPPAQTGNDVTGFYEIMLQDHHLD